jgi:hypothetical protein
MMDAPYERRSLTIFDILRSRVRAASDGQLVLAASLGVAGLVTLGVLRRWPWPVVALCGVLLGAGAWGILDRSRAAFGSSRARATFVQMLRTLAGLVALISLLVLLLGAFGLCLGPWIS